MDEQLDHLATTSFEGDPAQAPRGWMERRTAIKSMAAITTLAATGAGRAEAQPAMHAEQSGRGPFIAGVDGTRLFYRDVTSGKIMVVAVRTQPTLAIGTPADVAGEAVRDGAYDVAPDGSVLAAQDDPPATAPQIKVVLNWFASPAAEATHLGVSARGKSAQLSNLRWRSLPMSVSLPIDR